MLKALLMVLRDYTVNTGRLKVWKGNSNCYSKHRILCYILYLKASLFDGYINFRYNVSELVEHGKIVALLDNGQEIESDPSVLKLNCEFHQIHIWKFYFL